MPVVRNILLFIATTTLLFACEPKQEETGAETPAPVAPENLDVEAKKAPEKKDIQEEVAADPDAAPTENKKVNPDEVADKPKKDKPEQATDGSAPEKP